MRYNTVLGQSFSSCIKSTDRDRTMLCSNWKKSICDLLSIREILLLFSWKKVSDWKNYLTFNDELTVVQDLFFYNNRIFIPFLERNRVLTEVHTRYVRESKCLNRARELVWWPVMTREMGARQNMSHHVQNTARLQVYWWFLLPLRTGRGGKLPWIHVQWKSGVMSI